MREYEYIVYGRRIFVIDENSEQAKKQIWDRLLFDYEKKSYRDFESFKKKVRFVKSSKY